MFCGIYIHRYVTNIYKTHLYLTLDCLPELTMKPSKPGNVERCEPPGAFSRGLRGHHQAVQSGAASQRLFRPEGRPAAGGLEEAGARFQYAGQDQRRAHRARGGRAG